MFKEKNNKKSVNKTKPTARDVSDSKLKNISLGKKWSPYSREVRVHVYIKNMEEMVRFYNQILEFPVVRYWRYADGDGTQIDLGGNIIELFSKGKINYGNKSFYGNVSLSLRVPNVYKLHEKFMKKNIQIGELVENPWGDASFHILDPEGNRIAFFSPVINKDKYYKVKKS